MDSNEPAHFSQTTDRELVKILPGTGEYREDFYAGSSNCAGCHPEYYAGWIETEHARAFVNADGPSPHGGSCKRCHSTGDNEAGVGCEACHGPSGTHSLKPDSDIAPECVFCEIKKQCIRCHTQTIDPDFSMRRGLEKVGHGHVE